MFIRFCSRLQRRLIAGATLLCISSPALAIEYTFRKVLDYTGQFVQAYGPSLNDNGAMAFTAFLSNGTYGAYAVTEDGDLVTIADSSGGYSLSSPSFGRVSINNSNTIAFAASTPNYPFHGIYRSFSFGAPEVFTQVSDNPGGFQYFQHPWISNSNAVVYVAGLRGTAEDPIERIALMSGSLPRRTAPAGTESYLSPDINSIDSIVAYGHAEGSTVIFLNSNIVYQASGVSINDSGTIAFYENGNLYGTGGIYTGDGVSPPTLYAATTGGTTHDLDINNSGLVAYMDGGPTTRMIHVGSGHERLMESNQLFGSFLSSNFFGIQFYRGLNNLGQIAFSYTLQNGEKGIALATPRDPTMLGNGDFNNGRGLFDVIDEGSDGFAFTPNVAGDPRLQMTTENGVLGLRQGMDTTGDPYLLQFDFDWLTNAGSLEVVVNDVLALSIGADGSVSSTVGLPVMQPMGDLTHLSLQFTPADFDDPPGGYIRFDLHPGSQATIQLDNISFAPVIETTLPGDYNGDGTVDAADYTVWRDTLGSTMNLAADGDGDGTVDAADYLVWKTDFGAAATGAAGASSAPVVPEPASLTLLVAGSIFLLRRRHDCRRSD